MSGLPGHPGVGPDDPGSSTGFLLCGASGHLGDGPADPDDPGALPDDPSRSNCSGFPLRGDFLGGN